MAKNTQFKCCVFKLHQPSAWRREMLDHVFTEYTLALNGLLDWSKVNLDTIRSQGKYRRLDPETGEVKLEKYTDKSITQVLPKPKDLDFDIASCLKEALVKNIAAMLASYLELDQGDKQEAGFPTGRDPLPNGYPRALEQFAWVFLQNGIDTPKEQAELDEDITRAHLLKMVKGNVMPINFCRARDFAILTDEAHERFFVWLKLLPETSELVRKNEVKDLVTIARCGRFQAGDTFTYRGKSGVLFPIELGRNSNGWGWQYSQFMQPSLEEAAFVKSAKLVKDNGDYFLHVSFGFEIPEKYKPVAYLGIDRGILHTVAYGVVDQDGAILEMGHSDDPFREIRNRAGQRVQKRQKRGLRITKKDYKQRELDGILHRLINDILDKAVVYQAMVVMEDLNLRNVGKFYKSSYEKMAKMLEYKASWRGVPVYGRRNGKGGFSPGVWAAYTSRICIHCGEDIERDDRVATCPACGRVEHSDEVAGVNIARRAMYRAKDWGGGEDKAGDYRAFHRSFANEG